MTEAAGERFAGLTRHGGARRGRRRAARGGADLRAPSPTSTTCRTRTARASASSRSSRCSGSCAWTSWPRPPSRPCATGGCASIPRRSRAATWTGWRTSGPWCISRQLWWGHQIPVWYRGERGLRGVDAARGRRLGARPRRARHLVLERAVAVRDARLARARRPSCAAFYPTDVLSTARDILFLWVARMVMMGLEFTRRDPVHRRLRALGHPGARRPPHVQVAGHRHRPARPDRRGRAAGSQAIPLRRRRRALRPAGHVLHPGRALQRGARSRRARSSRTSSATRRG